MVNYYLQILCCISYLMLTIYDQYHNNFLDIYKVMFIIIFIIEVIHLYLVIVVIKVIHLYLVIVVINKRFNFIVMYLVFISSYFD